MASCSGTLFIFPGPSVSLITWRVESQRIRIILCNFAPLFFLFCHIIFAAHSRKFTIEWEETHSGPQLGSNQSRVTRRPYNSVLQQINYPFCFIYNKVTFTMSSKVFLESSTATMYFGFGLSSIMFWITLKKVTQFSLAVIISKDKIAVYM